MQRRNPFRRPFPDRTFGRSVVLGHVRTAAFVFVALLFLFPVPRALAYGLVTFAIAVTYSYLTERLGVQRTGRQWTMARWTLDQAVLLLLVSAACFLLYNYTVGWTVLNLRVFLYISLPTVLVGLLPIVFSGVAVQLRAEGENQRLAVGLQPYLLRKAPPSTDEAIHLGGVAGAEVVPQSIAYGTAISAKATRIYTDTGEQNLPLTLVEVVDLLASYGLVQCHIRYLVNPAKAGAVAADAQGVWIHFSGLDAAVPVGRTYLGNLKA
ncbi:hypothetical protein GGR28_003267 [Lewinella aquimaris]|uniref:HTH LytTR-type domain-containing protein n=1 Tax=Neolewinella aquimaris TaxID=1835722 RepID=A0A840EA81_9BACT|nr:LytTR family DNA-binding domain-containing protein [Neolewinella aquimaris]MBB4080632.1 hypothetical protein [Neolewinella aquimaris]